MINPTMMKPATKNAKGKDVPKRRAGYYIIDENRIYPSVTSILQVIAKPQLIYWSAKVTAEALMENPMLDLDQAIAAGKNRKEAAGATGSTIHTWIEAWKQGAVLPTDSLPVELQGYGKAFLDWAALEKPEILVNEMEVFSDEHKIAGKIDMIARVRGKVAVIDAKTGSGVYPEYGLQMAAYQVCINEMAGDIPTVEENWVLHLKRDGNYEFRKMNEPFDVFLAAKKLWEWTQK